MRSSSRHFAVAEFVRVRAVAAEFVRIRAMVRRRADGVHSPRTAQRSSALPLFRSSALPLFRSSALPLFRSSALPLFRSSALPLAVRALDCGDLSPLSLVAERPSFLGCRVPRFIPIRRGFPSIAHVCATAENHQYAPSESALRTSAQAAMETPFNKEEATP
jgi:hypothetical protein